MSASSQRNLLPTLARRRASDHTAWSVLWWRTRKDPPIGTSGEIFYEDGEATQEWVICAPGPCVAAPLRPQAYHVGLAEKLQIKPGQPLAILSPALGVILPTASQAASLHSRCVIGLPFTLQRRPTLPAVGAARAGRLSWIGDPKGGKLGTGP
jgi:hypothetical protein